MRKIVYDFILLLMSVSDGAFLQNAEYVAAMLICLHALESNKVVVLAEINPKLVNLFCLLFPSCLF